MPGTRRLLVGTLALIVALAAVAGVAAWWHYTTRPDYLLQQGQEALHRGRPDKAERLAQRLEILGWDDHARLLRGEAFLRDHQFDRALYELNQIQDRGDLLVEASVIYGLAFLSVQRLWEAEKLLRHVLSKQPDRLEAHRGLAAIYYDQGALMLAVRQGEECARLEPRKGYPYRFLGVIFKDLARYAEARAAYEQALERELSAQQGADVKEGLAEVLVLQKEYTQALKLLEDCPSALTSKPTMLACRAECLWTLDRAEESKRLLNEALQVDHHDSVSRYQLVQAYQRLGRAKEAALQQQLLKQTQDYLTELTKLNEEIAQRPWDGAVRTRLAEVCDKLDKPELAAMWRRAAAASLPELFRE
jgi:tetratricopeptide (TPR) repeat protein